MFLANNLTITDSKFYNSSSELYGGIIYIYKTNNATITNCSLSNSSSEYNGGNLFTLNK